MHILDNKDRIGSLLILLFSIAYLRLALVLPLDPTAGVESFTPRTLPIGLAVAAILFSFVQLVLTAGQGREQRISAAVRGFRWMPTLLLTAAMVVYVTLFDFLGFLLSSFLFLLAGFLVLGERRVIAGTAVAATLVLSLWFVLTQLFGLYLDAGELYRLLLGPSS